jgi:arabinofuranan 3-O-arabinosyltransferase
MTSRSSIRPAALPMVRIGMLAKPEPRQHSPLPRDRWLFLIAFLVALGVFAATDTGRIIFDTKLGVDVDAGQFLSRLWSLWNPQEWFGSLRDQYIGYAIPMAPFFWAGQLAHVPIWLIERLWLALIIAVGFTGLVKLGRALQIGTDGSRLLAGAVFALWPTFTILIGSTSAAVLPGLVAPWALLPLVSAVQGRSTATRAAARSGLAIAAMGGVNAVYTLAVLILPALYILTHTKSRQRAELGLKWVIAVFAGTAWWAIPLLLQGKYAFNFLPYIEQSETTARTMSAAAVLRGTSTWTAYFNLGGTPWLQAGWAMISSAPAILASAVVSAVGLAGLARRDMPERRWLCICVGLAAILALAGYYGPLGGPWHAEVDAWLDGPLAPFRSLYKLEPVIAVALTLGVAHAMGRCWQFRIRIDRHTMLPATVTAPAIVLVLAGLALPQLTGQVLQAGSFTSIPGYWYQTARYLAARSARQTALVVPANAHAQYTWGDTIDDVLEPLATSPWAERGLVPYGGAGSQILLQTAEQAIESGGAVPGLPAYLARAGIRYVVVRNDTSPTAAGFTPPQVVNETMAQSGFRRVASFGPPVAVSPEYPNLTGQAPGFAPSYPAVEIFTADSVALRPASPVEVLPVSQTVLVNGGPDSLLQLAGQGILTSQPTVVAGQPSAGKPALWAITDGERRADNDFGSTNNFQSFTYTANETNPVDDPLGGAGGPPRQILPVSAAGHQTVAVLSGAASVTASSAGTWLGESPQYDPVNAFDGNPATAWAESNPTTPVGQWIQINFGHPIRLPSTVGIQLLTDTDRRSVANQLRVTTSAGSAVSEMVSTGRIQPLRVPAGLTKWLRITITAASNVVPGNPGAGITDILIPGVRVARYLQVAEDPAGVKTSAVVYSFSQGQAGSTTLDRVFTVARSSRLTAHLSAMPEPGPALQALIARLSPGSKTQFRVTATSTWDSLPAFGPDNLFEPQTGRPWLASASDPHPTLELTWHGLRTISKLVLKPAVGLAAAPTGVLIGSPSSDRLAAVGLGGIVEVIPALRTDKLYLTFSATSSTAAGNTAAGQPATLPVGLAGVSVPALSGLRLAAPAYGRAFHLSCGSGPSLSVDGHAYQTSVSGTLGDLIRLQPVQLSLCAPGSSLNLPAGQQRLTVAASAAFTITGLTLSNQPAAVAVHQAQLMAARTRKLQVLAWQSDSRELRIGPGVASYVEVHENANAGWTAAMDGRPLQAATLDGWQQAFIVPAGQGGMITLSFHPAGLYHDGIIGSAILLLILAVIALGAGSLRRARSRTTDTEAGSRGNAGSPAPLPITGSGHRGGFRKVIVLVPLAAVLVVAGGPVAVAVPVLAMIDSRLPKWRPRIALGAMLAAGVTAAAAGNPTALGSGPFSGTAQAFALLALAAALLPAADSGLRRAPSLESGLPDEPVARIFQPAGRPDASEALEEALLGILACPVDKGSLIYFADQMMLYNPRLRRRYEITNGVPVMLAQRSATVGEDDHASLMELARAGRGVWTLG